MKKDVEKQDRTVQNEDVMMNDECKSVWVACSRLPVFFDFEKYRLLLVLFDPCYNLGLSAISLTMRVFGDWNF